MEWYKSLSKELSLCYFMQNEDYTDEELDEAFAEDETIIQGELMRMLIQVDELEDLYE